MTTIRGKIIGKVIIVMDFLCNHEGPIANALWRLIPESDRNR